MTERLELDKVPRLGIDIGRVILAEATDTSSSIFFNGSHRDTKFVEGSIDAICALYDDNDWGEIHLVSKCGPVIQRRTIEVLEMKKFFESTKIQRENVHFCLHRKDKATIASALGLTHFVDDRLGILKALPTTVTTKILFFESQEEPIPYEFLREKSDIFPARGWQTAYLALKQSIEK